LRASLTTRLGRALLLSLLAAGCAAVSKVPEDPGLFLVAPGSAKREFSVTQSVRIEPKEGEPFETLAAVELDATGLRVAALGPMGNRILFLEWDGTNYHEEHDPHLPQNFPLKLVLRDLMLSLFPADAVRKELPSDWTLQDLPRKRIVSHGEKPIIVIEYSADDRFQSDVNFQHLTAGYRLKIRTVDS